jgi:hypothetical protein
MWDSCKNPDTAKVSQPWHMGDHRKRIFLFAALPPSDDLPNCFVTYQWVQQQSEDEDHLQMWSKAEYEHASQEFWHLHTY